MREEFDMERWCMITISNLAVKSANSIGMGGALLAEGGGGLAFEGAHFVFLLGLDLIRDGEVVLAMAAQVERIKVTGGVFDDGNPGGGGWIERAGLVGFFGFAGARLGFVMGGGGDEVAITRINVEVISHQGIGDRRKGRAVHGASSCGPGRGFHRLAGGDACS